ncbi:MAG: hypothetical protein Q8Q29_07855 [Actinomycetota bacterium]|nr:hypothetical protein [Actinomycetota bacterium]
MDYAVTALAGYGFLVLTYSFLRTQWPDRYYSVSDIVGHQQSVSLQSYLLFRFAPAIAVTLVGSGLLRQVGKEGWPVWAAALTPVVGHVAMTHGRALLRSEGGFGRRRQVIYHLLAATGLLVVGVAGVWMSAQEFARPLLPSLTGIADGIWTALLAALLAIAALRVLQPEPTDDYTVIRDAIRSLDSDLVSYARSRARAAGADEQLVVAVMAVESIQRPRWLRRIERVFSRLLRRGTYGIMQVASSRPLSDRESIDAAINAPLAGVSLDRDKYGRIEHRQIRSALDSYNSDPAFIEWLSTALDVLRDPDILR